MPKKTHLFPEKGLALFSGGSSMANGAKVDHMIRGHKATLYFTETGFDIEPQKLYAKDIQPIAYQKRGAEDVTLHHRNLQDAIRKNQPLNCDCMLGIYGVAVCEMAVDSSANVVTLNGTSPTLAGLVHSKDLLQIGWPRRTQLRLVFGCGVRRRDRCDIYESDLFCNVALC